MCALENLQEFFKLIKSWNLYMLLLFLHCIEFKINFGCYKLKKFHQIKRKRTYNIQKDDCNYIYFAFIS